MYIYIYICMVVGKYLGVMELLKNQLPGHQFSQGLTRCMVLWGGFEGLL